MFPHPINILEISNLTSSQEQKVGLLNKRKSKRLAFEVSTVKTKQQNNNNNKKQI